MRIANILIVTLTVLISANVVAEEAPMKIGIVAPDAAVFGTEYAHIEVGVGGICCWRAYFFFFFLKSKVLYPTKECSSTRHPCT